MPYFEFNQNNSGGSFGPPAINVIIEATDAEQANEIAENEGIYFDGCANDRDCPCCGDRWYPKNPAYDKGDAVPSHYSTDLVEVLGKGPKYAAWGDEDTPEFLVIHADGTREKFTY